MTKRKTWTAEQLTEAVATSTSIRGVLAKIGLKEAGGTYANIKAAIGKAGLDASHFTGQAWSKGKTFDARSARSLSEILVEDSDYANTDWLRQRLLKAGLKKAVCEVCGGVEWMGRLMPLRLDHINGDRRDHRLENLRMLCPNCDAQMPTFCGRNIGRVAKR